jgi:predicted HAD superfamily phosphohydrolase YqeG
MAASSLMPSYVHITARQNIKQKEQRIFAAKFSFVFLISGAKPNNAKIEKAITAAKI